MAYACSVTSKAIFQSSEMNEAEEYLLKHCRNTFRKSFSPSSDIAIISITSEMVIHRLNP